MTGAEFAHSNPLNINKLKHILGGKVDQLLLDMPTFKKSDLALRDNPGAGFHRQKLSLYSVNDCDPKNTDI